jgi:hypothetical protein
MSLVPATVARQPAPSTMLLRKELVRWKSVRSALGMARSTALLVCIDAWPGEERQIDRLVIRPRGHEGIIFHVSPFGTTSSWRTGETDGLTLSTSCIVDQGLYIAFLAPETPMRSSYGIRTFLLPQYKLHGQHRYTTVKIASTALGKEARQWIWPSQVQT